MWDNHPFLAYFGLWLLLIVGGGIGAAWAIKHLPAQPAPAVVTAAKTDPAAKPSTRQVASGKHASEASASRRAAQAKKAAPEKRRPR